MADSTRTVARGVAEVRNRVTDREVPLHILEKESLPSVTLHSTGFIKSKRDCMQREISWLLDQQKSVGEDLKKARDNEKTC